MRIRRILLPLLLVCVLGGTVFLTLRLTAHYPVVGDAVSYPVNQLEGFSLSVDPPSFSPFRGYTIRYEIAIDSAEVYNLKQEDKENFENLEWQIEGQWHRLKPQLGPTDHLWFSTDIGGEGNTGFYGSVVQKYNGYGTRLEPGLYRLTITLTGQDGATHYLAAEFEIS